ncbi:MAG: YXWGXW repeat-containing protein [Planctomycetes bacterium]|nr:YXWGXW repeat-containing protein [Planctomycetota bacterium]
MKPQIFTLSLLVACAFALPGAVSAAPSPTSIAQQPPPPNQPPVDSPATPQEPEQLGHGPIHEAFGTPVSFDAQPGPVVPKEPPAPVEELPPEDKPTGNSVVWIPGYWSWQAGVPDDAGQPGAPNRPAQPAPADGGEFLWVSGLWRDAPPGREYVPGYWRKVPGGSQWVSGYWRNTTKTDESYLPEPPRTLERGPSSKAPGDDRIWVSGNWVWRINRYVWQPGYWSMGRPDWIWVPATYVWTPGGFVYVNGYWDYPPVRRGVLYAPCRFHPHLLRPGIVWTPSVVVSLNLAFDHCFVGPRRHHYYFGDYYDRRYARVGYVPAFRVYHSRVAYDPIVSYRRFEHRRSDPRFFERARTNYEVRVRDLAARPSRSFAVAHVGGRGGHSTTVLIQRNSRAAPRPMSAEHRREFVEKQRTLQRFSDERREREHKVQTERRGNNEVRREPQHRSPISGERSDRVRTPPSPRGDRNSERSRGGRNDRGRGDREERRRGDREERRRGDRGERDERRR